jgi:catechol 2,3-dioxygenase-like lactoylglutathione lyase family enzyme
MSAFTALDHVIVGVRDLEAAAATYAGLLGRTPSWRGEHPGWGTANALYRLENVYLELVTPTGDGPFGSGLRSHLDAAGEGPVGFALGTGDADALAAALRDRGLAAGDPLPGEGRDTASGAVRRWRNVMLPREAARGILVFGIEHRSPPESLPLVVPDAPAAAVTGIDHVVVRTDAPEAAIAFYGEGLGLRLALDRTFEAWGARLLFFRVGGITIEVAAPARPPATPAAEDQLWGISWRVPDAAAARARLAAAGFDVSELRPGRKPGTRVCTVRGPTHGVATLLIEPAAREAEAQPAPERRGT